MSPDTALFGAAGDTESRPAGLNILLVEDSPSDAAVIRAGLSEYLGTALDYRRAASLADGLAAFDQSAPDCLLVDLGLPDSEGLATLDTFVRRAPDTAIVVLTGLDDEAVGQAAVRAGAQDYLVKGRASIELLARSVRYAVERKRADEQARETRRRFMAALDVELDGFFILGARRDGSGSITDLECRYLNQAALRLFGLPPEDVLGRGIVELYPSLLKLGIFDRLVSVIAGEPARLEAPDVEGLGPVTSLDLSVAPFGDGVVVSARDTSARQATQAALRASEVRYRTLAAVLGEGIVVQSPDGSVLECNAMAERILGPGSRPSPGQHPWWRGIHEDGSPVLPDEDPALQTVRTGEPARGVVTGIPRAGGTVTWALVNAAPLPVGDGPPAVVSSYTDITQIKQAEAEVRDLNLALQEQASHLEERVRERTAQLEAMNAELESFSYSVSHDLRAPLRSIQGFAAVLTEDYAHSLDPEARTLLAAIARNAIRMSQLIDDILALSRVTRSELRATDFDMGDLVRSVVAEIREQQPGSHARFEIGELGKGRGDRALLRQVWVNLIGNAVKFTALQEHPLITVSRQDRDDSAVFSLQDNGAGFDPDHADRLFGAFQRLHGPEFAGTGIGLAIVRRIVDRHGGWVSATGAVGKGATFSFAIPTGGRPGHRGT